MIYYFSATGNSRHAAKVIADSAGETAVDMTEAIKNNVFGSANDEITGFVFPVYFWGLPEIVKRFAALPQVRKNLGRYVFFVITCGANTGTAHKMLSKALGRKADYCYSLRMPDNYVILYDPCEKEKAAKFLRHADKELETICADIAAKERKIGGASGGALKSLVVPLLYDPFRKTKKFHADERCIGCGLCEKICPDSVIKIEDRKPQWKKPRCQHCTACINRCPVAAIQYGKNTAERRRYNYEDTIG